MQTQPRNRNGAKSRKRLLRPVRHNPAPAAAIPEIDELEYLPLEDEAVYRGADRYQHRQPGDASEEDAERVEAEITELFRCADRL